MGIGMPAKAKTAKSKEQFSADYHDYVIKDGRLIGDFDNMYRYSAEVPWHQDERCKHWYTTVGLAMIKERAPYDSILEAGCGLGYISARLKKMTSRIDAFDVSKEAIRVARATHEGIHFYTADIRRETFEPKRKYALVVIRDVFWYVFPEMKTVTENISKCIRPGGFLYIGQSFPALESNFTGKDVIPDPDALLSFFPEYRPVFSARLRNHEFAGDGPTLHFLGERSVDSRNHTRTRR